MPFCEEKTTRKRIDRTSNTTTTNTYNTNNYTNNNYTNNTNNANQDLLSLSAPTGTRTTAYTNTASTSYRYTNDTNADVNSTDLSLPNQYRGTSSGLKLPKQQKKERIGPQLNGMNFSLDPLIKGETAVPIWHHPFFFDLYADPFKKELIRKDPMTNIPAAIRMKYAYYLMRSALIKIKLEEESNDNVKAVLHHVLKLFSYAIDMTEKFPASAKDASKYVYSICVHVFMCI